MDITDFTDSFQPKDDPDALPTLREDMRRTLVASAAACYVALKDSGFVPEPDQDFNTNATRMAANAIEIANGHARQVKDGDRKIEITFDDMEGSAFIRSRLARQSTFLDIKEPASREDEDIARVLIEAYREKAGARPETVLEALTPAFRKDFVPGRGLGKKGPPVN